MFHCSYCNYLTTRKYNLQRHFNLKHFTTTNNDIFSTSVQNVPPNVQNVPPKVQNVPPNVQNVPPEKHCHKCNKCYKTNRHLLNHESKCKGIDELTCTKCMTSFTTRQHKYNHVKRNTCKARSIVYARIPNLQNSQCDTNGQHTKSIHNINNTINNIQNNNVTNNNQIIINNMGSERLDHISHDDILHMLTSGENTIPLYIKKKHFDEDFPENNNIRYTLENKCKIFENDSWKEKDIVSLSSELIQDNTEVLLLYCDDNQVKMLEDIKHEDKFKFIKNKLLIIYSKSDNTKYAQLLSKIKDLIKNSKLD